MQEQDTYYLNEICTQNALYTQQTGRKKKCLTHTFGCQMNERDSEILFGFLAQMGYEKTDIEQKPTWYCSIPAVSVKKRRAKC